MTTHSTTRSHKPVARTAPQYKADNGPLGAVQLRQIKKRAPEDIKHSLRTSLLDQARTGQ